MQYKGLVVCFSLEKINTLYLTVLAFSWQAQLLSENAGSGMQGNTERTLMKRKKESEVFRITSSTWHWEVASILHSLPASFELNKGVIQSQVLGLEKTDGDRKEKGK